MRRQGHDQRRRAALVEIERADISDSAVRVERTSRIASVNAGGISLQVIIPNNRIDELRIEVNVHIHIAGIAVLVDRAEHTHSRTGQAGEIPAAVVIEIHIGERSIGGSGNVNRAALNRPLDYGVHDDRIGGGVNENRSAGGGRKTSTDGAIADFGIGGAVNVHRAPEISAAISVPGGVVGDGAVFDNRITTTDVKPSGVASSPVAGNIAIGYQRIGVRQEHRPGVAVVGVIIVDFTVDEGRGGVVAVNRPSVSVGPVPGKVAVCEYRTGMVMAVDPTAVENASTAAGVVVGYQAVVERDAATV